MDIAGIRREVDRRLDPWSEQLGADRPGYTNHCLRVLTLCDRLAAPHGFVATDREEFLTAGAFHDIGVWSANTFDYLEPSAALATAWLTDNGRADLIDLVARMVDQHHKLRPAATPDDPVEIFRRADAIDIEFGILGRFGVPRSTYRELSRDLPDAGFHRRLLRLGAKRIRTNPLSPLPMLKW
ncbi:HD domain-containing protein [Nocardia sp. NPDC005978]|uniref:HD domain-containing protein n=1 Tax=Nocardia sp. NPDC005978 TaxID=3156725 RepID=UPI0033B8D5B9